MNNVSVLIIRTKKSSFQDGVRERYVSMIRYYFTQIFFYKHILSRVGQCLYAKYALHFHTLPNTKIIPIRMSAYLTRNTCHQNVVNTIKLKSNYEVKNN